MVSEVTNVTEKKNGMFLYKNKKYSNKRFLFHIFHLIFHKDYFILNTISETQYINIY